jgi:hypothetical protein
VLQGSLICANDGQTYWFAGNLDRHRLIGAGGRLVCQIGGGPGPGEAGAADVTLYGVEMRSPSTRSQYGGENDLWAMNRFAVLHSSLDSYRYALFLMNQPRDVIVANSVLMSGGGMSVHRVGGCQRCVYVDNRFAVVREGGAGYRQHDNGRNIYNARNQHEGAGARYTPTAGVAQPGVYIDGLYIDGDAIYGANASVQLHDPDFSTPVAEALRRVTMRNVRLYSDLGASGRISYTPTNQPGWSVDGVE